MGTTVGNTTTQIISSPPADITTAGTEAAAAPSPQPQPDPQTDARNSDSSKKLAMSMRDQQTMQGQLVQQKLSSQVSSQAKIPTPAELANKREEGKAESKSATEGNTSPATTFAPSKSAVQQGDVRLSPNVEYEKLPEDLKGKLNQQLWSRLGTQQRTTLIETYSRMKNYGLWDEVKRITGEKEQPEPHVKVPGGELEAPGNSGGITYEAYDGARLVQKMKATGHFGEDGEYIGALHKGQRSMREWSDDPKSLHISVGPGNKFDGHIDKKSPTNQPQMGNTKIDPIKGKMHHTTEVWPEKIRNGTGIPGVIVEGKIVENKSGWHGGELQVGVKVELHGPAAKKKTELPNSKPDSANPVPQQIMEKINQRLIKTKNEFPVPIGFNPDEVPTKEKVAAQLAAEIMDAARNGRVAIQLNFPQYLDQKGDQAAALATMKEISEMVRSELIAARAALPEKDRASMPDFESVRGLTMTFGAKTQRGIVSMTGD